MQKNYAIALIVLLIFSFWVASMTYGLRVIRYWAEAMAASRVFIQKRRTSVTTVTESATSHGGNTETVALESVVVDRPDKKKHKKKDKGKESGKKNGDGKKSKESNGK